jgi:hypothetical protein
MKLTIIVLKKTFKVTHGKLYLHLLTLLVSGCKTARVSREDNKTSKKMLSCLQRKVDSTEKCKLINNKNLFSFDLR